MEEVELLQAVVAAVLAGSLAWQTPAAIPQRPYTRLTLVSASRTESESVSTEEIMIYNIL